MSITLMEAAFAAPVGNMGERVVLVALADFANDAGICWPSIETLAKKAACTARAVQKIIERLKAAGHLLVTYRHRHSSLFKVNLVPRRVNPVRPRVNEVPPKGERSSCRTVKEPSINLRDAKSVLKSESPKLVFTETPEERELKLEAHSRGFRDRGSYEKAADYRKAMHDFFKLRDTDYAKDFRAGESQNRRQHDPRAATQAGGLQASHP